MSERWIDKWVSGKIIPYDGVIRPYLHNRAQLDTLGLNKMETPLESANNWIDILRGDIESILLIEDIAGQPIDQTKALRGIIVEDINGDGAGVRFSAAMDHAAYLDKNCEPDNIIRLRIIENCLLSGYLIITGSLSKFGQYVPNGVHKAYSDILKMNLKFLEDTLLGKETDPDNIFNRSKDLRRDLSSVAMADGMKYGDIKYGLYVLKPNIYFTELFER